MKDLNLCQFIGNITKELELKFMPNGDGVLNFSIACNDDYKDKNGIEVKQANFIDCVAFRKPAELIGKYCSKGSKLYVSGKQKTRKWQDKEGNNRYSTEINIDNFQFLSTKDAPTSQPTQPTQPVIAVPVDNAFSDDIPF